MSGEIGDNLLDKYKIMSVAENFSFWCEYFLDQSFRQLESNGHNRSELQTELSDIKSHILAKSNNIFSMQNANGEPYSVKLLHNVSQWKRDNYIHPLSHYKYEKPTEVKYVINEENKRLVKEMLTLYSENKSNLWKVASSRYYLPAIFREERIFTQ